MLLRRLRAWLPALLVVLLGSSLHAQAAPAADDFEHALSTAVQFYDELEYEQALSQLQRARAVAKGDDQESLVDLHEGIFLTLLGRTAPARTAFENALVLDPSAKLPLHVSPKVQREFEAIRQTLKQRQAVRAPPPPRQPSMSDRPEAPPPASTQLLPPKVASPSVSEALKPAPSGPSKLPLVLLGGAGALAGGGALLGVLSRGRLEEARREPFEAQALAKLGSAQGLARGANLMWGAAGLAVVGAVVTWFLQPGKPPPAPESTQESTP